MKTTRRGRSDSRAAFFMLLPFMLFFAAFVLYPLVVNLYYGFTSFRFGAGASRFVGFANYERLFRDPDFIISLKNTFVYAFFSVIFLTSAGLLVASVLNRAAGFVKAVRVAVMIPYATSLAAAALIWMLLLDPAAGFVNKFLLSLGAANPPNWLFSPDYALPSLIGVNVWKNIGYVMIIFLAGLQGVPLELYEAAKLDGAGAASRFRYVTLPSIFPVTMFVIAACTIEAFKTFELVTIMTKGGPMNRSSTVVYQIYIRAFEDFQMGYAASMSTLLLVILLSLSLLQFKAILRKPS